MNASQSQLRLQALRRLLESEEASTQDDLREELERQGFEVTQSTISRDLRRVGAIKSLDPSGEAYYRLASEENKLITPRSLRDLVHEVAHNEVMIVIHTAPGAAHLIARHADMLMPGGTLGTIAGDDTIFIAPASIKKIKETIKAIQESF